LSTQAYSGICQAEIFTPDTDGVVAVVAWIPKTWHAQAPTSRCHLDGLKELIRTADVFIQNMRPGTLEEIGLGPKVLMALIPALMYCSVGAFGHVWY
jgi:hypothetical protein